MSWTLPPLPDRQLLADLCRETAERERVQPILVEKDFQPAGKRSERDAHVTWMLEYGSEFGEQRIQVEAAIRPVLRPSRRASLRQLLQDRLAGDYAGAFCHALDAAEARAEKVRAAFTREEARDFYNLQQLKESGTDFSSAAFQVLVDTKLAELGPLPPTPRSPTAAPTPAAAASPASTQS